MATKSFIDFEGLRYYDEKIKTVLASKTHLHDGTEVSLSGYEKPSSASAIAETDTVNSALGKLEKALDGKAAISHGTHVTFSTTAPVANGTASAGGSSTTTVAKSDHVHPLQTTISGNAGSATKLATARSINGTSFNGESAITTAKWGTARDISISDSDGTNTGTAVSVNGSANAALKLPATIKASITGNVSGSSGSCTGNAATATKLAAARSLWGNNFDGSAAISGTITGTPSIEFKPTATTSNNGGYLDFHYNQSTADYTSRIIESASGTLSINNVTITTGKVVTATTFTGALSGNASSATITKGDKGTGSYVNSVKSGNALVNADNTQFGTIFNAPTKNYRVGCATWPDSNDNIVFYSITNANVSSSTNATNKTMTWNGDTGILTATGFTGSLTGNVTGNCSGSSGSCTGNAKTATTLQTARTINGVSFDGSANITVADSTKLPLAGGTMTGQITYKVGSITRGTAPSSSQYPWGIRMVDNASVALSGLYYEYLTDKTAKTHLMCYQGTTNANTWKSIGIGYNTSGNPYTWSITPGFGDNSTQIATTEFVYKNAAKHLAAAASIYVAKAATGNGSGSSTSNYMSLADLRNYLATVHMHSSTADMNGSYTLTILFKAGDSFGNASFDAAKMPGIRNLVLNTSTGTASTTSNYSTNSPTFGNLYVTGDISVTIRNINCTGRISAQYGAYVAVDTYVGLSSLHASNWAYINVAKNMVIDVCDAHTDYLFAATNSGILAMWPGATVTINFRQQCYYTRCLFTSSTNGTIFVGYSSFKLTGTKPMMIWAGSGTLTGTSETAAGTAAKVVPLASGQTFTLATNATAKIRFTVDNTAANPTLDINSTGAKPIWWNGAPVAANMLAKNMTYDVKYDGTHYVIQNALKRLTNNDYGIFRSTGNYNQTYNSGSWNFDGYTVSYGTGIENGNWRGNHIGNIEQRITTGNNTYPILFSGTANATANTSTIPYFGSGVKINPSTSTVYATTFSGAFSGNASTATKLATARAINGTNFDGSAAITTANWGTARNIYVSDSDGTNTGTAVSVNGSGNATLKLPATIKASITGNVSGSSGSCTGNAATATKLATAKTIGISGGATGTATSFDGSENITIPVTALDVSKASAGTLAVARGGTGLASLDTFVRTTGNQTIAGTKTFSAEIMVNKGDKPAAGALSHVFGVTYQNTGGTQTHTAHPISVIGNSNADNAYNTGVRLGSLNGTTVVSAGESGGAFCTKLSKFDDEVLYLEADNEVQIYCKCANDMATYAGPIRFYGTASDSGGTTTVLATNFAGNASTATKLATARNINGVAFDGSANITVADSTKVAKSGDTMTGNLTISKAGPVLVTKSTGMTRNTAPSAAVNTVEVLGQDSAGKSTWGIYHTYGTDKANRAQLICYKGTSTDNTWSGIGIGYDKDGNVYTNAPTPAAGSNTTHISTTAWVRTYCETTKKFLTSHQSLAAYAKLAGAAFTGDVSFGGAVTLINNGFRILSSAAVKGTAPSTDYAHYYMFYDKNSKALSACYLFYYTSKATAAGLRAYKANAASDTASITVSAFYGADGTLSFRPSGNGTIYLGQEGYKWKSIYCGDATIHTSDKRLKTHIDFIPDEILDAWSDVEWRQFKFKDAISEKGEETARLHTGLIAQDIEDVFASSNLDAAKYGLFCHHSWDKQDMVYDQDGNIADEGREAGDEYAVRYAEALCMEAAYQRRENKMLKEKIANLEEHINLLEEKLNMIM